MLEVRDIREDNPQAVTNPEGLDICMGAYFGIFSRRPEIKQGDGDAGFSDFPELSVDVNVICIRSKFRDMLFYQIFFFSLPATSSPLRH